MNENIETVVMPKNFIWSRVVNGIGLVDHINVGNSFSEQSTPNYKLQYRRSFYTSTYINPWNNSEHILKAAIRDKISVYLDTGEIVPINNCFIMFNDQTCPSFIVATEKGHYLSENSFLYLANIADPCDYLAAAAFIDRYALHLGTDYLSMYPQITASFNWQKYDNYFCRADDPTYDKCHLKEFGFGNTIIPQSFQDNIDDAFSEYLKGYAGGQEAILSAAMQNDRITDSYIAFTYNTCLGAIKAAQVFNHLMQIVESNALRTQFVLDSNALASDAAVKVKLFLMYSEATGTFSEYVKSALAIRARAEDIINRCNVVVNTNA